VDYESIKSHFNIKHYKGDSCMAVCPCHDDKQASLSIGYDEKDSKTLLYCHAGCSTLDILDRVGLKMRDLFQESQFTHKAPDNISAIYKYTDSEGKLLFEKVRFYPKKFSHRRYEGGYVVWGLSKGKYYETYPGSFEFSMKERKGAKALEFDEVKPVLYNLPAVIEGVKTNETIYIVEGEKDADNLISMNLTATTNFDGASKSRDNPKWREAYNEYLKGADVVLVPDNDIPGKSHMEQVAKSLKGTAKSIKMVELPVPTKEDISYWLGQGHSKDELVNLVNNTVDYSGQGKGEDFSLINYNFSDVGNAERLIAMYGNTIRFSHMQDAFLIWSGRHWQADSTGGVMRLAKSTLKSLKAEGEAIDDSKDESLAALKKQILSFAVRSENDSRIRAMVNLCKSHSEIIIGNTDSDPFLLNVKNGTLNLKTGKLQSHVKSDYITKLVDIDYDIEARCDNWRSFLDKIFMSDKELVDFVQKSVGYSLTCSQEEQCFYILYGGGANGKSTFLNTIKAITGDYADTLKGSSLMARHFEDGARGDLAKLSGKRFVVASELNEGQTFDESLIKAFTGDDAIPVRFLYGEEFDLIPGFKIWVGTNEKPKIRGTNQGIWRRVRMIPFLHTFSEGEKDKNFFEKHLAAELPGILNWAMEGCLKWQKDGMVIPQKVKRAGDEYKGEMDLVQRFLDESCITGDVYTLKVGDLYQHFCNWCSKSGDRPVSNVKFGKNLKEKGFEQYKANNCRYWKGIGVFKFR